MNKNLDYSFEELRKNYNNFFYKNLKYFNINLKNVFYTLKKQF